MQEIDQSVLQKAQSWLNGDYDAETKLQVRSLMDNDPKELTEAFYRDLEFGTGGLRGIMGVGTNRMNKYTVAMATQGLANYLKKSFPNQKIKVAIAFDSRNNSAFFAEVSADVLSSNDINVYLFDELRPTPELSFAVRYLKCQSGIVITASHNPKEYNGYKVYWDDGGQLIYPHDENVIAEVQKISSISEVHLDKKPENIIAIGEEIDKEYISRIKNLSLSPEIITKQKDLKIVYTAIHGTGYKLTPLALKEFGFTNIIPVDQQMTPDGNFPTVKSPNPEESAALSLALEKAVHTNAYLLMGTDPDADRVGIAVRNDQNEFILLNGNQTGTLLIYYLLKKWKEKSKITGNEFIVKTIVTSELLKAMSLHFGVECFDVLTGFKYIADIIKQKEGIKTFIGGGEESYGYLVGDFVRDKDAVIACCMIAETAAWAKENGKTMFQLLIDIYSEFGFYKETLLSITKKGKEGAEEIQAMMNRYRSCPPESIAGSKVIKIADYQSQTITNCITNADVISTGQPKANVLQFFLADGSKITVRPSGTEPKIKFYFGIKKELPDKSAFDTVNLEVDEKIKMIIQEMNLN